MDNTKRTRNERRSHGAGKARRVNPLESLNDLAIVLFLFVEPISNMLASLGELGRHRFDSFKHWIQSFWEQPQDGKLVSRRVLSRDLKSVQFLKQGFSGYIYETTWSTWYGMERPGRYARKDFPGVDSKVFEGEAARLVNLDHPNLVKTYCWTVDRLGCSLVMEFVSEDLESIVRKRKSLRRSLQSKGDIVTANSPFELVEAMYIMWHIAAAMEYLHSMEVAHGDLRPNNVLVDLNPGRMIVKVVDFGLIESKKRTTLVSKRAKFLQILEWKAPEMCKELVNSLNVTSDQYPWTSYTEDSDNFQKLRMADMYSFAILCTYIMGGIVSYPRSSLTELQQKLLSGTLKPKMPSTCPRRLKKLIESCWSRIAPEERIDFHKFSEQLEDIIRQETTRGPRLHHPEVGGIMQRWVENIQQMGINNTLYYTYTATLYFAGTYFAVSKTIPIDNFPPVENAKLSISESAEPPPSPATKLLPRPSLEPLARLTAELAPSESLDSPLAMLNTVPSPSGSLDSCLAVLNPEPSPIESLASRLAGLKTEPTPIESRDSPATRLSTSEPTLREEFRNNATRSGFFTAQVSQSELFSKFITAHCEQIERSEVHWSELPEHWTEIPEHWTVLIDPAESREAIRERNLETFASLKESPHGEFFLDNMGNFQVLEKFAEGAQASIFKARWLDHEGEFVLKWFKGFLVDLQRQWPMDFLLKEAHAHKEGKAANPRLCHIYGGLLMDDGHFAFAMERYWGDLRKLIDIRMKYNGKRMPPFTTMVAKRIMLEISEGMERLHEHGVRHRDVKASNIFIKPLTQICEFHPEDDDAFSCLVGDFECSIGVLGTGFWRAPEVLLAFKNRDMLQVGLMTKENDVYSFSMTCYEILTGHYPFMDLRDYDHVLGGARPTLPPDVHPAMESLLSRCWHHDPSMRPTFVEIRKELENMILVEEGKSSENISETSHHL